MGDWSGVNRTIVVMGSVFAVEHSIHNAGLASGGKVLMQLPCLATLTPTNVDKNLAIELEDHAHVLWLVPAIHEWYYKLVG